MMAVVPMAEDDELKARILDHDAASSHRAVVLVNSITTPHEGPSRLCGLVWAFEYQHYVDIIFQRQYINTM
jgi:hypothetical protein